MCQLLVTAAIVSSRDTVMVELSNAASVDIFLERFVNLMIPGCQ